MTDFNLTGQIWGMPADFTGHTTANITTTPASDSITNWIAVIIALGSLVAFFILTRKQNLLMNRQTNIQEQQANISGMQLEIANQQLLLIQKRDEERLNDLKKANIRYQLTSKTTDGAYQNLIITNDGPSEARTIRVHLGERSLNECQFPVRPRGDIERLAPKTEFRYGLYAGVGVTIPAKIALFWSDDFSENRELNGDLSYT
jgi:hypothetical protein